MKQDSAGQFSQCNRCGARIMWVKTKAGKNMPVDPQFVDFKKIKGGKERLVLPNGEVVAGEDVYKRQEPYRTIRRRMTKKEMEPTAITSRIQFRNWKRKIRSR